MTRGLPISMIVHALALGLVLMFGNVVQQKTYQAPQTIGVRLVELPKVQSQITEPIEDIKEIVPPKPKPKIPDELPPKELPKPKEEPKKDPPKKELTEEKPKEVIPELTGDDSEEIDETEDAPVVPLTTGTSVDGTDSDFPFAWYLSIMEGQIARNWNPKQMGFRSGSGIGCVVHFTIQQSGAVVQVTMERTSGVGVYDREALRAVQSTRLPQLPADFGASSLGVTMTFNLESGN